MWILGFCDLRSIRMQIHLHVTTCLDTNTIVNSYKHTEISEPKNVITFKIKFFSKIKQ